MKPHTSNNAMDIHHQDTLALFRSEEMHLAFEIPKAVRLEGCLPETFEHSVLHYEGTRRYLATWWSEDYQCVVWADGETWRGDEVDEDEWIWWTYKLALSNGFETDCLGFDLDLPLCVLMLDLQEREVWRTPIGAAFDFLHNQIQPQNIGRHLRDDLT